VVTGYAADNGGEAAVETGQKPVQSETGHVEGYMTLPLGDAVFDATYVFDKTGRNYGKVLILPDRDGNIDSHDLVHTLRMRLAESGWSTMTLELQYRYQPQLMLSPELAADEAEPAAQVETTAEANPSDNSAPSGDDNAARVAAAVAYLNAQQAGPTIILAMGQSAELSSTAIAQAGKDNALIWISPEWNTEKPPESEHVLDITVSDLSNEMKATAQRRAVMMRQNIANYSQRQIPGTTSSFYGFEQPVFNLIRNWLHKIFAQGATG